MSKIVAVLRYATKITTRTVLSLLATLLIIFVFVRISGDPLALMLPETAGPELRAVISEDLGLDKPMPVQFVRYLSQIVQGDLGTSFRTGRPVADVISERIPATLQLAGASILLTLLVAVPLGILAGSRHHTWVDSLVRTGAFMGQSLPNFWVAIMLVLLFSVRLGVFPAGGRMSPLSIVLPAVTMSLYAIAGIVRVLRSSMLESWRADYVITARAKGVPRGRIIRKHVLRNALLPTITFGGILLVMNFLTGSIVIETVFAWPGIGRLMFEAIVSRDFPLVQAIAIIFTGLYVLVSLVTDLVYGALDPRTRI